MGPSDGDLIKRCLEGDNTGFDLLVKKYQRQILSFCFRMLGDADEAADAAQESFLKAYYALGNFRQDASFGSWLFKIASNACVDRAKKRKRREAVPLDDMEMDLPDTDGPSPEQTLLRTENEIIIRKAMLGIPEKYRTAIALFHFSGLSIREISETLARPEGTVKSDLHIARELLRRKLEGVVEV